jgi:hypothetical protein
MDDASDVVEGAAASDMGDGEEAPAGAKARIMTLALNLACRSAAIAQRD